MKKSLLVICVFAIVTLLLAPLSFSQYYSEWTNVTDEKGQRQGGWRITAGMMQYSGWTPELPVKEGYYLDGQPVGSWVEFDKAGNIIARTEYDTIMHHATLRRFSGTQVISESNFIDGWHDGIERTYYADGTLQSEYTWKNGRLNGPAKTYYPNGKICEEGYWRHNYWDKSQPYTFHKK